MAEDKDKDKGKPWVVEQARRAVKAAEERVKEANSDVTKKRAQEDLKKAQERLRRLERVGEKSRDARSEVRDARAELRDAKKTPGKADDRKAQERLDEAKAASEAAQERRGRVRSKIRDQFYSEMGPMIAEAIKEFPPLRDFFQQAIAGGWNAQKQERELANPENPWHDWWKSKGIYWREGFRLQYQSGGTKGMWDDRLKESGEKVRAAARAEGVQLSEEEVSRLARRYWYSDWQKNADSLTVFMQRAAKRQRAGESGVESDQPDLRYADRNRTIRELGEVAESYGISFDSADLERWADRIRNPKANADGTQMSRFMELVIQRSRSRYGVFADQISNDMTLRDLAGGYMDELTQMLELRRGGVRLNPNEMDPLLQRALTNVDRETGKPAMIPLWEFRKMIREDERWQFTDNARDSYMSAGTKFAKALGLAG